MMALLISEPVYRVCLASDVGNLRNIDSNLLEIYEKLTRTSFTKDGMPNTICYICHWRLQKCRRFSDTALRSDKIFRDLLHNNTQITNKISLDTDVKLRLSTIHHVCIDPDNATGHWSLPTPEGNKQEYDFYDSLDSPVTIKLESVTIKKETREFETDLGTDSKEELEYVDMNTQCEKCSRKFKSPKYLKAHMVMHSEKPYSCEQCGRRFNHLSYFHMHMRSHKEGKPYPCTACKKTFHRQTNLNKHMQNHTEEKYYICDRCSKKFKQKSHLKVHLRIHSGEKLFACEICGKTFNQIANLNKHMGIHTGVKPFSCELCGKAFLQRAQVKAHMRSHTGEKPYRCDRCQMAFSHASPLRKHSRLHIDVKPYDELTYELTIYWDYKRL